MAECMHTGLVDANSHLHSQVLKLAAFTITNTDLRSTAGQPVLDDN